MFGRGEGGGQPPPADSAPFREAMAGYADDQPDKTRAITRDYFTEEMHSQVESRIPNYRDDKPRSQRRLSQRTTQRTRRPQPNPRILESVNTDWGGVSQTSSGMAFRLPLRSRGVRPLLILSCLEHHNAKPGEAAPCICARARAILQSHAPMFSRNNRLSEIQPCELR
jgi:hypothetical protein